ncbi:helix-turn-helix transcriptional regulator [Micromonospora polyrhachis]|uniref:Transcriptional regulator with XRE-family HTH domain n=1 Tax=Micromonospora polyrhachis TaxID=1282883 RepID=A0A7W7WQJ7_9ACTN|nr:helix-turn-helix transcriptional regulator [Micromonospora polyrhachis]MBB4960346.1 transcriptional regulator with XRE-family HTH domain [Micromonospora polyrhachis]
MEFLLREMRKRRIAAGLTQQALGERIYVSDTVVSAIETGSKPPKEGYLKDLDAALETGGLFVALWQDLVSDGTTPVWLQEWIEIERAARVLRWFEPLLVPGLLQTEEYARAVLSHSRLLTDDEVEQRTASRMERQSILNDDSPPQFIAVIDGGVLRRRAGSRDIMRRQCERLLSCLDFPHVAIHVVPGEGIHAGLAGGFILARGKTGDAGHVDTPLRAGVVTDQVDIDRLDLRWESIRSEALPRESSAALIKEAATSWT